jgi:ABC-2 type transport system ATP-binding protein
VVEIDLAGLSGKQDWVLQAVRPLVNQTVNPDEAVRLEEGRGLLTVRALNAVGTLPAILNVLEHLDLQAGDVRVRKNTLEDVFIRLTGRRLRE